MTKNEEFIYNESLNGNLKITINDKKIIICYKNVQKNIQFNKKFNCYILSLHTNLQNRYIKLPRLIWIYHNGYISDEYEVIHIDGDINNNLITNLSLVKGKYEVGLF